MLLFFGEVGQAGEQENGNGEKHHEQAELLVAALERVAERLEAGGVARQLEDPEYAQHTEQGEHAPRVIEIFVLLRGEHERDVVGQYGDEVDEVEQALDELQLARTRQEAQQVLEREPRDAHGLDRLEYRIVHVKLLVEWMRRRRIIRRRRRRRLQLR